MNITDIQNAIIPALKTFCGVPIIEADGMGEKPEGAHATFKFTMAYGKGIGQAEETAAPGADGYTLTRVESYRATLSMSAYDLDNDTSRELAQRMYDWFSFHGYDHLNEQNIVVSEVTDVINRDTFVLENYERRNGFDVIIRVTRELARTVDFIERVDGI